MTYLHTNSLSKFTEGRRGDEGRGGKKETRNCGENVCVFLLKRSIGKGFVCPPQVLRELSVEEEWRISLSERCTACVYTRYSKGAPILPLSLSVEKKKVLIAIPNQPAQPITIPQSWRDALV